MPFPTAVQLYSVRHDAKADLRATLETIKKMGYDGVEFAGLHGHPAEEVRVMCGEIGLVPISAHIPMADLMRDPAGTLAEYAALGCRFAAIPSLSREHRPASPSFPFVLDFIAAIARAANAAGIGLMYHNHDFEFIKLGGKYALDLMYETIPSELLAAQLDTCWINVGGLDPAAYIRKYAGRVPVIHLKDFWGERAGAAYELIGEENTAPKRPEGFEYRPLGSGLQDMPSILAAARDSGTEWVVVEQDSPSMGLSPMQCIEKSIEYLAGINK